MNTLYVSTLDELIRVVLEIKKIEKENVLYFRGESKDYGESALQPSLYRNKEFRSKEDIIYREMQRYNVNDFDEDKTTFDKISRMQHYQAPTRLIDISEDLFSALHFSLGNKEREEDAILYVLELKKDKIKYFDSDSVSVVSNLVKVPLNAKNNEKSKANIHQKALEYIDDIDAFNEEKSTKFLLHEIKEEKAYFENIINPKHLFSIFCVKPKYSSRRIFTQKGAFLLFGMNKENSDKAIELLIKKAGAIYLNDNLDEDLHPIANITKIFLHPNIKKSDIELLGITEPHIYPEIDKIGKYIAENITNI